ncbi:lactococcin 972 family bacteriocin [Nocardiopsis sp. B62]|uniref:lactococcin 972 family bacteriocin n=1 Tax=Nocardiopsis sp. B62 TaxID=2824874 RepID=UPI001B396324|nr:lactococcin 972 family bacteriocin [Nocardiopsis sp. B62]MBQ1082388.1 lactococcin 972 family bacteriocin [Nocardiopsis sp. B62]
MKALLRLSAIVVAVLVMTTGTALAQTSRVGGGVWERSLTGIPGQGFVRSYYHHPKNCHGATAVGTHTERVNASAGFWARAEASRAMANNQQYWRNGC